MVKQSTFMLALFAIAFLAVSFASAFTVTSLNVADNTIYTLNQNTTTGTMTVQCVGTEENKTLDLSVTSNVLGVKITYPTTYFNCSTNETKAISLTISNLINLSSQTVNVSAGSLSDSFNSIYAHSEDPYNICSGDYSNTNITFEDVDDEEKGNEDAWAWRPLDEIELTVNNIENKVDKDVKFDISLLFYKDDVKVSDSKIADDEDSLTIDNLKINGEDSEDASFTFKVSGDVKEGNYDAYVKVKGSTGCYVRKISEQITVEQDSNNVIVNDVEGPVSSGCGESVDLSVDVSNIGSEDEDQVKVLLYNRDLGLSLYKEIENLDSGDSATVLFSFVVPQNAQEKLHRLVFSTEFEYDDDDEEYDSESDSEDDYTYSLNLLGNCVDPTKPTVTAKLNSTAVVGEDLVVEVTLKNNGNTSISAIIAPEEYDSWAEFVKVDPATVSVGRLESKKVYITFTPTEAGQQTFNLNVIYNGKSIDQPVTLTVDKNTSFIDTMYEQLGKTGTYLVIAITLLVVLILLVLVVRLILSRNH